MASFWIASAAVRNWLVRSSIKYTRPVSHLELIIARPVGIHNYIGIYLFAVGMQAVVGVVLLHARTREVWEAALDSWTVRRTSKWKRTKHQATCGI